MIADSFSKRYVRENTRRWANKVKLFITILLFIN